MTGNVIYRGPITKEPQTISYRTVASTYLPGTLCTDSGTVLTVATAADMREKVYVLANRNFYDQDVTTAYASGDTGVAYEPLPGEVYQVRMAAATYAKGEPLTLTASGRLTNVLVGGDTIYAYFSDTAGAYGAGDLADVIIAAGGTVPDGT